MMKSLVAGVFLWSLVSPIVAQEITTVSIWYDSEQALVYDDYRFTPETAIQAFDMALHRQTQAQLNAVFDAQGIRYGQDEEANLQIAQDALGAFMGTPDFAEFESLYKEVGASLHAAFQYRVEKVPTIIFNEKYTVIGVNSLAEAVAIFKRVAPDE